jgi:VWFA-related protein
MEIVLVVDAVNTAFTRVAYERSELDKFLKRDGGKLARPVQVVFVTDSGLDMEGAPSLDGNTVDEYLDQHVTGLRAVTRSQGFYGAVDRLKFSLDALTRIAQNVRSLPGRKIVVWISPGWPLLSGPRVQLTSKQEQQIFQNIVGLSTELRESSITLYAVDPSGTADAARSFYYQEFLKGVKSWKQALFGNLALQVIATHSGGRVLNSNNDVAGEVETCIRDTDAYYVLTFDAQPADGPDDYHQIEVKLSGHDLKAQTLSAYYAQPPGR